MSSFICPTCGVSNIDCGKAGYKTNKEIEFEKENAKLKEECLERKKLNYEAKDIIQNQRAEINKLRDLLKEYKKYIDICCVPNGFDKSYISRRPFNPRHRCYRRKAMINKTKDLLKELIYFIVCCGY